MNEAVPKSEWVDGPNGKPQGPWQSQYLVYLLNFETMDRYSFPTGTVGGGIAVRELVDKTKWIRRIRGEHVYPVKRFVRIRICGPVSEGASVHPF